MRLHSSLRTRQSSRSIELARLFFVVLSFGNETVSHKSFTASMNPTRVLRTFLDERGFKAGPAPSVEQPGSKAAQTNEECGDLESSKDSGSAVTKSDVKRTVAVSLSGGVDSMALCSALVHLKPVYGFEVMGIHIDYGNRHESAREADFVESWCSRHGVVFYKRAIAEVGSGLN